MKKFILFNKIIKYLILILPEYDTKMFCILSNSIIWIHNIQEFLNFSEYRFCDRRNAKFQMNRCYTTCILLISKSLNQVEDL